MADPIEQEIQKEIADNKILIYGKGTKSAPQCGFTVKRWSSLTNSGTRMS